MKGGEDKMKTDNIRNKILIGAIEYIVGIRLTAADQ